jgi:hypothetical protein
VRTNKRKEHPFKWIAEPLMEDASYLEHPMFGCLGCYFRGQLVLVLASRKTPWNGLLIPTDHQYHDSLRTEFEDLVQHPILKKWLFLPETTEEFEDLAGQIVEYILKDDIRFGVEPRET